ncbi:hypothetical protein Pyn_27299 [Prunus yedoensis var. nudiflora]|uniref:Uncharacterized protein n=1 Tax=Prunus yedoensis var. nudiflora TaxID=2094558 RepID=A0A314UE99_PRUYE|nr:hypothetical protein Pyn_27299 [Prunus yedoensis var. nudiflora]
MNLHSQYSKNAVFTSMPTWRPLGIFFTLLPASLATVGHAALKLPSASGAISVAFTSTPRGRGRTGQPCQERSASSCRIEGSWYSWPRTKSLEPRPRETGP